MRCAACGTRCIWLVLQNRYKIDIDKIFLFIFQKRHFFHCFAYEAFLRYYAIIFSKWRVKTNVQAKVVTQ